MRRITLVLGLLAAGCGGSSLKGEGEECVASSECGAGLICDFAMSPHVCVPVGSGPAPDASQNPPPDASPNPPPDSTPGAPDANPPPDAIAGTQLTVKNYAAWCDVTVNGGTPSSALQQVVTVTPGVIPVSAVALGGFELGLTPWHNTDGDLGGGEQGQITGTGQTASSATTETVGLTADCVWVCCQTAGQTDCPTTDQCP
jgi:hypothetical protein